MSDKIKTPTLESLQETVRRANEAIGKLESTRRYEQNIGTLGKFFKYRNCYSCPKKPSDYWPIYAKVTAVDKDGHITALQFETDKYGSVSVKIKEHAYHMGNGDGWTEITASEYRRALKALKSKIAKL